MIDLGKIQISNSDESDRGWVHPFECNTLDDKLDIIEFMSEIRHIEHFNARDESQHLDVCRQIGGGC